MKKMKKLKKTNKMNNSKWFISLATSDYGGGCEDGTVFDSFDELASDGLEYLKEEIDEWKDISEDAEDDDFDNEGFEDLENSVKDVFNKLLSDARKNPNKAHSYSFGPVDGDDTYLIIRPATESDIKYYS